MRGREPDPVPFPKRRGGFLMFHRSIRLAILMGSATVYAIASGDICRAASLIIPSGYDVTTFSSVSMGGLPAIGVSLQSFDFGPPIGTRGVGNASYIDQRLSGGSPPPPRGSLPTPAARPPPAPP